MTNDLHLHASASKDDAEEGQCQMDIEEGSQLGGEESSYTSLILDSSAVIGRGGEVDDVYIGETSVEKTGMSERDGRRTERPSGAKLATDLSNSHPGAKNRAYDTADDSVQVYAGDVRPSTWSTAKEPASPYLADSKEGMPMTGHLNSSLGDCPAPSCAASTEDESYSTNTYERKEGMSSTEHLNSSPADVSCDRNFANGSEQPNGSEDTKEKVDTFGSEYDELPSVPLNLRSQMFEDRPTSKENVDTRTLGGIDDTTIAEKWSRIDAAKKAALSGQSANATDQPLPAQESYCSNQGQTMMPHQEVAQQSRDERTEIDVDHWIHRLPSVSQRSYTLPRTDSAVLSHSVPNESVQEEDENDKFILVPEAFLVEANAPMPTSGVGFAELIEPDQNRVSLKKRHACVVSIFIAATVIALGLTIKSRGNTTFVELPEEKLPFSSPSQASVDPPSSQPTLSIRNEIEENVLQRNVTFDTLEATNARVFALEWITNKDQMGLIASDSNLFQRYILALLAFEFSNSRWLSDRDECTWDGVECDKDGRVVQLELASYRLDGTIPPEIGRLQSLQNLTLSENSLRGTLPSELAGLKKLSSFSLRANSFTGPIPSVIGGLKELAVLDLSMNKFSGMLPLEFGNLNKLTTLYLDYNKIAGTLQSELGNLKELTSLSLIVNRFTGTLPSEFGSLNKLTGLRISSNKFTGTFPSELSNLSNLTQLNLDANQFTGSLPSELGNLNMLNELRIDNNKFVGTVPSVLGNCIKLTLLYFNENRFTGTLPSELGNLKELVVLETSKNILKGTLPREIGNLNDLIFIGLNENQFTGAIPAEVGGLNMLNNLRLFTNKFSGTIPSELQKLTSITEFSITSNRLSGTLPSWLGNLNNLWILHVGGNKFTGTLPSHLGLLTELTSLKVNSNEFTGTIPSWIGNLSELSILWLDSNQFTGTFPLEIGANLDLKSLCIRNNKLAGSPPAEIQTSADCQY
ncbi:hypothetical protein HJC23_010695 [Cyclotella cryptica]|uniref:Disease resistance R13L4/SHOC-2-like LRR domain-containing protein n=1 Tax=Cyclotella cryptica TaxID=29204 RepID=A0ABD3P9Q6_9STRA